MLRQDNPHIVVFEFSDSTDKNRMASILYELAFDRVFQSAMFKT